VWCLGSGKRGKSGRDVLRSPSTVREEHEKRKAVLRPSSKIVNPSFERAGKRSGARRSVPRSEERRDLDLHTSVLSPLTSVPLGYPQPTAILTAREAELARRSRTGATKWYWPAQADWRLSSSRERSELSNVFFLGSYRLLPTTCNAQPSIDLKPAKRNWRDVVVLAPRSGTGLRKQTGGSKEVIPDRGPG
jgi:hypothetical protein